MSHASTTDVIERHVATALDRHHDSTGFVRLMAAELPPRERTPWVRMADALDRGDVAARLCIDHRRSHQAEDRRIAALDPTDVPSPCATVESRETADLVARAIGQLPDRERACFLLTVCEGFSYRDAAETLGLSYAEVNNAIHRARTLLRSLLASLVEDQR